MLSFAPPQPQGLDIAIVGGGLMGHALAAVFLAHGSAVTVCEPNAANRESLLQRVALVLESLGRPAGLAAQLNTVSSTAGNKPALPSGH